MKGRDILRILAVPLLAAHALEQEYCSSENTATDYGAVTNIYQSNGACHDQCVGSYAFAIVQYQQCWCTNYAPADTVDVSSCSTPCPGYPSEFCGNNNSGLYGYIALSIPPSGTAGFASSTEEPSSTSPPTTSVSITTSASSTSDPVSPTSSFDVSTTAHVSLGSSSALAPTSSTSRSSSSSLVLTSSSLQSSTSYSSTSQQHASTTAVVRISTTSASSPSSTTSTTSTSSTTAEPATATTSTTTSTPSAVVSTHVVTISGAIITQTVTSTPTVFPSQESSQTAPQRKGISSGAVAGIVIAVILAILAFAAGALLLYRRRRQSTADMAAGASPNHRSSPHRNVSVLSKVGLLPRSAGNQQDMSENAGYPYDDAATGQNSVRHSMLFNGLGGVGEGVSPVSPLGSGGHESDGSSRRYSRPLVYDQRLNPSALFANADAMGSRVSIADNQDYSRSLGRTLGVMNPDTRSSFASSRGPV